MAYLFSGRRDLTPSDYPKGLREIAARQNERSCAVIAVLRVFPRVVSCCFSVSGLQGVAFIDFLCPGKQLN